jgi:hypothetical protein
MTERLFQSASPRAFFARELRCTEIASFGLDHSAYDHLRIAQQSQSIAGANRKYLSNQREDAIATFGLRPVAQ